MQKYLKQKLTKLQYSDDIIDALSIDCVIFGFKETQLYVLLVKHGIGPTLGQWALPGSWIRYNESIDAAASRILSSQTSVGDIFLEQFKTFRDLERFPARRVITISLLCPCQYRKV